MKPEVKQIFSDLEAWHNYCRFNMLKFDPADLYVSKQYKDWQHHRRQRQSQNNRPYNRGRNR
jgi:hypothetical protein